MTLVPPEGNCGSGCIFDAPSTSSVQVNGLTPGRGYNISLSTESYGKKSEPLIIQEQLEPGQITHFLLVVSTNKVKLLAFNLFEFDIIARRIFILNLRISDTVFKICTSINWGLWFVEKNFLIISKNRKINPVSYNLVFVTLIVLSIRISLLRFIKDNGANSCLSF